MDPSRALGCTSTTGIASCGGRFGQPRVCARLESQALLIHRLFSLQRQPRTPDASNAEPRAPSTRVPHLFDIFTPPLLVRTRMVGPPPPRSAEISRIRPFLPPS